MNFPESITSELFVQGVDAILPHADDEDIRRRLLDCVPKVLASGALQIVEVPFVHGVGLQIADIDIPFFAAEKFISVNEYFRVRPVNFIVADVIETMERWKSEDKTKFGETLELMEKIAF